MRRVIAIVPAYNEAASIAATVRALGHQWAPALDHIIVVPNNCFALEQEYLTASGLRTFADTAGTTQRVLTRFGWRDAEIRMFGDQPTQRIVLAPAWPHGNAYRVPSRSTFRRTIEATPTHRWITTRGAVTDLRVGDVVLAARAEPTRDGDLYRAGQRHGFIFGDGTLVERRGDSYVHDVSFFGAKRQHMGLFDEEPRWRESLAAKTRTYAGTIIHRSLRSLKELPHGEEGVDYIAGFIAGWIAADGATDKRYDTVSVSSSNSAALDWLQDWAPIGGYLAFGRSESSVMATNFGVRRAPLGELRMKRNDPMAWRVVEVTATGETKPVACAVVPGLHEFTLAGGVLTGNCTDTTAAEARNAGATVLEFPGHNPHKKAGALNWALDQVLPHLADDDMVLITDADSVLDPDFTQHAVRALLRPMLRRHRAGHQPRPAVGAACAQFRTAREPGGLLARVQRNEYERFARQVSRRGDSALVLSGVATMFLVGAIRHVTAERSHRLPGYPGEFYHRDTATEDIELTFAFRELGYRPMAPAGARAQTDIMPTRRALGDQRLRWQRGMLDSLRLYGLTRTTAVDALKQVGIYAGSLAAPAYLAFLAFVIATTGAVPFSWGWAPVTAVFIAERVWTVRTNPWRDVLMAAALLPEWLYEQWRSAVYWSAAWKTLRGARREWINA